MRATVPSPAPDLTCHPGLSMPGDARKRAIRRLKIARGHLESIVTMLGLRQGRCAGAQKG
ncbi:hypothetical protein BXU09_19225 [Deinococcus sp. LM3]|nr:hypothetical protein BXU09_19225 [Deinococcus sp. LM3]